MTVMSIPEPKTSVALRLLRNLWSIVVIVVLSLLIATVVQGLAESAPSGKAVGGVKSLDGPTQARAIGAR